MWITPDPLAEERQILGGGKINLESLLLLEARPCAGESDAETVAGAWDFEGINRRNARHLKVLGDRPGGALRNDAAAKALLRWAAGERETWLDAVTNPESFRGCCRAGFCRPIIYGNRRGGGGWKCSGTPAGNCARSTAPDP